MSLKAGVVFLLLALSKAEKLSLADIDDSITLTSEVSSRNAQTEYRLPTNVIPSDYDIHIDLFFAENSQKPFSYNGRETIVIQAVERDVRQIVLHANVDVIETVTVTSINGQTVPLNTTHPFEVEKTYHFLKINLLQALELNEKYDLKIHYSSTMNDGPMKRGIWKGWYKDANGIERTYAATHFQPYNARQAFPCWDEPLFKAVFKVHLTTPQNYGKVYSNTEVESVTTDTVTGRITTNFYETPVMSSYLVTFLASETFEVIAEDKLHDVPIRIIGRSNTVGLADHALHLAVKMTEYFDKYFEIPYASLHQHLLNDHISSPDWASAGTENWGMVSYRELYLILDPKETIMSVEHYAATLVSHELAHKWMGNLITCYWWSNTWINEGFASYFGYIATHEVFPEYELNDHFNSRYLQNSLSFDSGTSTVPLNHDVNTPAQVTGHFGTISYSKGAAFLRMLTDMITRDTFQKASRYFLTDNKYKATDQYDLYYAFEKAIQEDGTLNSYQYFNFTNFYDVWVNEAGYPILKVEVDHDTGEMYLSQERFFLSPTAQPTGQIYPIPITFCTETNDDFNALKPSHMMSSEKMVLTKEKKEEWVIFNNQQHGLYRVHYDDKTWELIADALLQTPQKIHHLNRAQVVDDVFALLRSERMTYDFGFKILRFLRYEDNYHVWNAAITGYNWLRNRFAHLPETQATFDSHVLSYMEHVINEVGFEPRVNESATTSLTRQEVLHFACLMGHERCVSESRSRFVDMRNNIWIDPRIRRNVYVVGIREGGEEDFNFLLNRFHSSNYANDQLEMLRGLGATRSPQLVKRYLDLTLQKEVRSHDKVNAFNYALLGNRANAITVLEFVKEHIDDIRTSYVEDAPANPVHTALSNLSAYLDEEGLVEYEAWLRSTQSNTAQYNSAISAITSARNNMAWGSQNADRILSATRSGAIRTLITSSLIITMALLTFCL